MINTILLVSNLFLTFFLTILIIIIMKKIKVLLVGETQDVVAAVAALTSQVASEQTVEQSAETLLAGLTTLLQNAITPTTDPATVTAINGIIAQVQTNQAALAAAVTANTPAAPASEAPASTK